MSELNISQPTGELQINGNDDRWLLLKHAALEKQLEIIFRSFREHQIEPIVIKGWAAGLVYPEKWRRYSSDIDLAISPG